MTFRPAMNLLPLCRTIILPILAGCPEKSLTPRYFGCESRPNLVEPAALVCAIFLRITEVQIYRQYPGNLTTYNALEIFTHIYYHYIGNMSTLNLRQIGEWFRKNQGDIILVIGFILVALVAFGTGRLTAPAAVRNPVIIEESSSSPAVDTDVSASVSPQPAGEEVLPSVSQSAVESGIFVASRGGTKYHWPWCSFAERIKEANKIWFKTEAQAQTSGYSACGCIQSKAPAGYKP